MRPNHTEQLVGGVEAGGTKFNCAVARGTQLVAETRIATSSPENTLHEVVSFFLQQQKQLGPIAAIGIGSFGPIDLNPSSDTYGFITSTPKKGWQNTNVIRLIKSSFPVPLAFDTDVNAAAYGEWCWGAAQGLDTFIYLTIGTGIGGGGMANGKLMHGLTHPEMGHILLPEPSQDTRFRGNCPYHGNCFEGLASGAAIRACWDTPAEQLPPDHQAWSLESDYIAQALHNYAVMLSPQRIILGGGVMQQNQLFPMIRSKLKRSLNRYIDHPAILDSIDSYVVPPYYGQKAGLIGSCALAYAALDSRPV